MKLTNSEVAWLCYIHDAMLKRFPDLKHSPEFSHARSNFNSYARTHNIKWKRAKLDPAKFAPGGLPKADSPR